MKRTSKGYTLMESIIVLSIISSILLFSFGNYAKRSNEIKVWENVFKSHWQNVRLSTQQSQQRTRIHFKKQYIETPNKKIPYPKGYYASKDQSIDILTTGYVAPTTIKLTNGKKILKIIFSFGGGEYRIENS
ncbi:prepilin-type N-terminal cleavage/methylation domain-containing protein [Leuconostoc palmae]|uniref:prepilin-type N-terminal cleavage/methylation domain-containing protein n=1 Tax=Leuconostoc palmae TaxID=501487 RepID=UPI001C7DBF34|nr:prepilin-type N-terminal cleavage/methylation domain-containing protein [Leuconostoc palmae]